MGYRYRDEIVATILDSATKEGEGIRMTKVMYTSYLSYTQVIYYLRYLSDNGLLEYDELNKSYKTTDKGFHFLELHNKMNLLLNIQRIDN
ncbi:MAG: winged helix-turn-helix domain-containing protein [Thermoproteota archaeon]|nr:winged helix-turn-helix domain-containing protein [Thermoproteota archaeon]